MKTTEKKKGRKKKVILWGLGLLTAGLVSFFGISYWKRNKNDTGAESDVQTKTDPVPNPKAQSKTKKPTAKKAATSVPPKTSATTSASPKTSVKPVNALLLAKSILASLIAKNFPTALGLLRTIKSTAVYNQVNIEFKKSFLRGVRQTLVNGYMSSFSDPAQKELIKQSLLVMGLKFDGKKWSLSGVDKLIITKINTRVWKDPKTSVPVPERMVLGKEIDHRGEHTVFENDGLLFLVESKAVQYYNQ